MKINLTGKVALVTGASRGIGRAIACQLAASGAEVLLCSRDEVELHRVFDEISRAGGLAHVLALDLTKAGVKESIASRIQEIGMIDIVVNNVGGAIQYGDFLELDEQVWIESFELNLMSMVRTVKAVLPWLKKSKSPRIINISSIVGTEPGYMNPHYSTMKAATINLSKYLAGFFANEGILVNTVCPGPVKSTAWDENIVAVANKKGLDLEAAQEWVVETESKKIPLGRLGECNDIANIVTFLTSDYASWITGACIHINGGKTRNVG